MASLEEILEYKRAEEQAAAETIGNAALAASLAGGATLGAVAGTPILMAGKGVNKLRELVNPKVVKQGPFTRLAPGPRVAGGLVGLIVGGALGNEIRDRAVQQNAASELLAKAQVGEMNEADLALLEKFAEQYYDVNGIG